MPLSDAESQYYESLARDSETRLSRKYASDYEQLGAVEENTRVNFCLNLIRSYAKAEIDSRVSAYIETFKKFKKFPNDEDFRSFTEDSKPRILAKQNLFLRYCESFYGPDIPKERVDALTGTLEFDLQRIFGDSLSPLLRFLLEGLAEKKVEKKVDTVKALTIVGIMLTIIGIIVSVFVPEIRTSIGLP